MPELRCDWGSMHGYLDETTGLVEVKCRNPKCGAKAGVVVLHRFDVKSGALEETVKFKDPRRETQ